MPTQHRAAWSSRPAQRSVVAGGRISGLPGRRPLAALSVIFAGFVLLALVSQLSWHLLAQAMLTCYPNACGSLVGMQNASTILAYSGVARTQISMFFPGI